jgi:hypothetical protein
MEEALAGAVASTAAALMVEGLMEVGVPTAAVAAKSTAVVAVDSTLVGADTAAAKARVAGSQPRRGRRVAARIRVPADSPLVRTAIPACSEAAGLARMARTA